jgi:sugar phosphate isomerase/epimerase
MLASIGEVVAHGELRDVVIGVQNHDHGCVTRTGNDVLRILNSVDSPYLGHILDTGQYVGSPGASGSANDEPATEQAYDSITATAPRALHVRAKFYRVSTGEERWLDYPRILEILRSNGFNGTMSVVYEGWSVEPSDTAVPKAVRYLRRLLREKDL